MGAAMNRLALCVLSFLIVAWGTSAQAAPAATAIGVSGTVSAESGSQAPRVLAVGSDLFDGETVTTQERSKARLEFADGGLVTLRSNSRLVIEAFHYEEQNPEGDSSVVNLLKGGMRAVTGKVGHRSDSEAYQAKSFAATIGIRGTDFILRLCGPDYGDCSDLKVPASHTGGDGLPVPGLYFTVVEGSISVTNATGTQFYFAGQSGYVADFNTAPTPLVDDPELIKDYEVFSSFLNCTESGIGCLVQ